MEKEISFTNKKRKGSAYKMLAVKNPQEVFKNWLAQVSENSKASYERVVPQFFQLTSGVDVSEITADTLEIITPDDVYEKYINELRLMGFKDSTISNYISVVRSFVTTLEDNKLFSDINYDYLKKTALSTKRLKNDLENRKKMSTSDYEDFSEWLISRDWSKRYQDRGIKYAMALKFMFVTAIRVDSAFNSVKWSNIKKELDDYGNITYVIYALDKGSKVNKKPISIEFYTELKEVMYNGDEDELIFKGLNKRSFQELMKEFSDTTGREMTPHSIKVGAGTKLYKMTKDIFKVQRFLDHSDPKVTMRYIRVDDMTESGSYMLSSEITIEELDELSYDDLVNIIKKKPELAYTVINDAKKIGLI